MATKENELTPLQEEAIDNLKMWLRNPSGINLGAALGYTEFDIHNLVRLGYTQYEQGKLEQARIIYEGTHALDPTNHDAMMGLGTVYSQQGHLDQAVELFDRILEEDPENLYVLLSRGECFIRKQLFEQAVADFKKILELDPGAEQPESKRALGIIASARDIAEKETKEGESSEP